MQQDLQIQIEELKQEIESLKGSNSIPREVETALRERLGSFSGLTGTGTVATGTLEFIYNGKKYNILIT